MNIVEVLKEIICETGLLTGDVKTDLSANDAGDYALYPTGETAPKKYINGDVEYTHNFVFYTHKEAETESKRDENVAFNKSLCDALNKVKDRSLFDNNTVIGKIKSVTAQNGMLFNVPGSLYSGFTYQIQIKITYKILKKYS